MKTLHKLFLAAAMLGAATTLSAQTTVGYSNGYNEKGHGVRFNTGSKQGAAIRITKEKAEMLKGCTISHFEAVFNTSNVEKLTYFITKDLKGEPLYQQTGTKASTRWRKTALTTPYTITGEEFYIGFTCEVPEYYSPLTFDESKDFGNSLIWAYGTEGWTDISNKGYGAANIRCILQEQKNVVDMTAKPVDVKGYFKAGDSYAFEGQLYNFGSTAVNSFDLTYQIGESAPATYHVDNVNIAANSTYDFNLPEYVPNENGKIPFLLTVSNINGGADAEASDNLAETMTYIYPADIQRKCLLENFTGQGCSNCPAGHEAIKRALNGIEDHFVQVAHHAGYKPDVFTMKEDVNYTWFYNSNQVYAPSVMFNRTASSEGAASVVFLASDDQMLRKSIAAFDLTQPYVSVNLDNEWNEATQTAKLTVKVFTHVLPAEGTYNLNVWVTQDKLVGAQAGLGNIEHNHVFRGSINGLWGEEIVLKEGETIEKTYEYTLPKAIVSTASAPANVPVPTKLQDMNFVAFVSKADKSALKCNVLNVNNIAMGSNTSTGIWSTEADEAHVTVNGNQLSVVGEFATATIYNAMGQKLQQLNAAATVALPRGMYVVAVAQHNGNVTSKKVYIAK